MGHRPADGDNQGGQALKGADIGRFGLKVHTGFHAVDIAWFFTYQFVMWPMLAVYPFLLLLTAAIPALMYRQIAKVSIIERLHQN